MLEENPQLLIGNYNIVVPFMSVHLMNTSLFRHNLKAALVLHHMLKLLGWEVCSHVLLG